MIALLVRDFAITQERHRNHSLADMPLVLIEAGKYRPKVIAPDARARQAGISAGDWAGQAQTWCPDATFLPVEESHYQRIFADITRQLLDITDRIEPEYQATSAVWYTDDPLMLAHLRSAILELTGIQPQIGIADTKFVARVAAAVAKPGTVEQVAVGEEATFLAPYPVTLLPLTKDMARRLPLLGIDTLAQLTVLPRLAVWEQFGKAGRWVYDLACGRDIRPLSPYEPPLTLTEPFTADDALSNHVALHQALERLSLQLANRLERREAHSVLLLVTDEQGRVHEYHRQPHKPVQDGLYLWRLTTQMLDSLVLDAPVSGIEVRLGDIQQIMPKQLSLFGEQNAVLHLDNLTPVWARRYRQAHFYQCRITTPAFIPEECVERLQVSGA